MHAIEVLMARWNGQLVEQLADNVDALEALMSMGGGSGQLVQLMFKSLVLVSEEVVETKKKGGVTITLNVLPSPGGDEVVIISEDVKRKPPSRDPKGAIFFAIGDGMLRRNDPRQTTFEVRQAEGSGTTELRVVEHPEPRVREAQ